MKRFILFVIFVALALLAISRWNKHRQVSETFTPASVPTLKLPSLAAIDDETTRLVQSVVPSVVSITTSRKVQVPQIIDPFDFFFGRRRPAPRETIKNSLGSGVIVSEEGHILTNYHVIANVDEILVQLNDGRTPIPARYIGGDESTDIAVIKIDAKDVKPLPLGDSDLVKVGQLVFAIGNPFGLQETVTKGIISATGRVTDEYGIEYFQTEAVINPGNSGGPLVNIRGEIIGINTAIGNYSGAGTWQGVGFAIPSNIVRRAMEEIIKAGKVAHGYLGVTIDALNPDVAKQSGIPNSQGGVVIREIAPGSPAEKAGLKPGDILVSFHGKTIKSASDLIRQVSSVAVGTKVEIKVIRDQKEQALQCVIAEQPAGYRIGVPQQKQQPTPQNQGALPPNNPLAGINVANIPKDHLADYPENVQGVYISKLEPRSPAANVLQPGDVIEQISGQPVTNFADYQRLAASLIPGKNVFLSIARGKNRSFVVIAPGE